MALVPCRECGKEIADSAPACPDCGAPSIGQAKVQALMERVESQSEMTGANFLKMMGAVLLPFLAIFGVMYLFGAFG